MRFVAGRGAVAKHLVRGAAVAERHREDANQHREATASGSAVAKRHRENAGRSALAKRLAALWRIAIRKMLPAGRCSAAKRHREDAAPREMRRCEAPCERRRRGE